MKYIVIIMLMLNASLAAQTHRFIYEYEFKTDSAAAEKRKASMVLDVNPEEVKFYNYDFVITDSINKTRGGHDITWDDTPALTRKRNTDLNINYKMTQVMFITETKDPISWKLLEEIKIVEGHHLQKAAADFCGRHWIAWFAKDIALSEGPYKFRGLPGMVFEVYDDRDNFRFSLVKSYRLV